VLRRKDKGKGKDDDSRLASLETENQRLKRAVEELGILNDLAREIAASLDSERIMSTIVKRSLGVVGADQGVITLVEREEKGDDMMKTLVRTRLTSSSRYEAFHFDKSLLGWMQINKKPLLTNEPREDTRFRGVKWEESIRSILAAPLLVKSELIGVLTVYNKKAESGFTEDDQRLLAIIGAQSVQVVENARLYEEEKALVHMREEVRFATEIQERLLPKDKPVVEGYDIAGITIPAQDVGGDYFDFIPLEGDCRLAFCLGDVTGKGLPAAMLMANLQATIRGQSLVDSTPRDCMARSNKLLFHSTDPIKFATLFFGVLCPEKHKLCYCSAGHDRPYFLSEGKEPVRLEPGGMMLGAMEEVPYEDDCIDFGVGDTLVIYSDGITEAMAPGDEEYGEEYGEERLEPLLRSIVGTPSESIIDTVIAAVREHAAGRAQSDDMTMLVIRRVK